MQKLKIRQYWTEFGRPWYVIRYGHKANEYVTATNDNLNELIAAANNQIGFWND
jgi:hypothetical protein